MIYRASRFANPLPLTDMLPAMPAIMRTVEGIRAEGQQPYAIMLPKPTQEEVKREVPLVATVETPIETLYGMEIIPCTYLAYSERFVILYR